MRATTRLLIVEDNAGDARLLQEMFCEPDSPAMEVRLVGTMRDAEALLAGGAVDVILLDLNLPDAQGLEAVQRTQTVARHVPLVVLTGLDDDAVAIQALQQGAQDYLVKNQIERRGLLRALRYAVERKAMEEALFAETERAQVTLTAIGDGVVCVDTAGQITFVNRMAEIMTGWSARDAAGVRLHEVVRLFDGTSHEPAIDFAGIISQPAGAVQHAANCVLMARSKTSIPVEICISPMYDSDGRIVGAVVVMHDVSAAHTYAQEMARSAQHDFLTGLPNRMLLSDRISRAIAAAPRHQAVVAVLFLDLDGFKLVNDTFGHAVGDKLLQSVSRRLVECVRASDTVSRQGGDEFVVLLSEVERAEDAADVARRMLQAVAAVHVVDGLELHVRTSIGVSVYPDDGADSESLIKSADTAMYQAKAVGRGTYCFFKPTMTARAAERLSIEQALRGAMERQEFLLHYQPQVDLRTGAITAAEALLRWTHPICGAMSPASFIPIAESCGLMPAIGEWVLREACQQARAWQDAGLPPTRMAVNISSVQLRNQQFAENLFALLKETRLDPRHLELDVTEAVMMTNAATTAQTLQALRQRGVQVAVDDFGTGFSSVTHLRTFPVNVLKMDQSFIRHIGKRPEDRTMVSAVINMGRSLNLRVVAEGVETPEEHGFLDAHHCGEAQGYYFSRPVAPDAFEGLLRGGIGRPMAYA